MNHGKSSSYASVSGRFREHGSPTKRRADYLDRLRAGEEIKPGTRGPGFPTSQGSRTPTPGSTFSVDEPCPCTVGAARGCVPGSVGDSADIPAVTAGELVIHRLAAALNSLPARPQALERHRRSGDRGATARQSATYGSASAAHRNGRSCTCTPMSHVHAGYYVSPISGCHSYC